MTILKNCGINYANYILDALSNYYADEEKMYIHVETFYNCREQGYVLTFRNNDDFSKAVNIWVYGQRNSDEPTISWGKEKEFDNMFTEETYRNQTMTFDTIEKAINEIKEIVKNYMEVE